MSIFPDLRRIGREVSVAILIVALRLARRNWCRFHFSCEFLVVASRSVNTNETSVPEKNDLLRGGARKSKSYVAVGVR